MTFTPPDSSLASRPLPDLPEEDLTVLSPSLPAGPCARRTDGACCKACVNARKQEDEPAHTSAKPEA